MSNINAQKGLGFEIISYFPIDVYICNQIVYFNINFIYFNQHIYHQSCL
jgi:hypothetical protein